MFLFFVLNILFFHRNVVGFRSANHRNFKRTSGFMKRNEMKRKLVYLLFPVFLFSAFFVPEATAQTAGNEYKMQKIVLDAGHGGRDPGCTYGGVKEKDVVLAVALRVGQLINENLPGVEVIYTRKTDIFPELMERANIANRAKADLFVSIHADAVSNTSPNGSSTWVMGSSQEATNLRVAMRENSVITYEEDYQTKYEGFNPNDPSSYIMFSLMQSAYFDQSVKLGTMIQNQYGKNTSIATTRGVKQAGLLVLHHTAMPSVLTEIGFLSNSRDRAFMTSRNGQEKIARSIFNAISEYKSTVEGSAHIITLENSGSSHTSTSAPASSGTQTAGQTSTQSTQSSPAFVTESNRSGVVFRVQVSASQSRVARNRFGTYANQVVEKKIGNFYKYFVGETNSYSEALSLQRQVRQKFRDAFIVAFENDTPVTITDAMKQN